MAEEQKSTQTKEVVERRGRPAKIREEWFTLITFLKHKGLSDAKVAEALNETFELKDDAEIDHQCVGRFLRRKKTDMPGLSPAQRVRIQNLLQQSLEIGIKALTDEIKTNRDIRELAMSFAQDDSYLLYQINSDGSFVVSDSGEKIEADADTFKKNLHRARVRQEWIRIALQSDSTDKLLRVLKYIKAFGGGEDSEKPDGLEEALDSIPDEAME